MAGLDKAVPSLLLLLFCFHDCSCNIVYKEEMAVQTCGTNNTKFFCPHVNPPEGGCLPRSRRCTETNVCLNPQNGNEDGCYPSRMAAGFEVKLGNAQYSAGVKHPQVIDHHFITYRGFTYEFREEFGLQILDIADPRYKYLNGRHGLRSLSTRGTSQCTWEDATEFGEQWAIGEYRLCPTSCQSLAKMMMGFLVTGRCNRLPPLNEEERRDTVSRWLETHCRSCHVKDNHRSEL